MQRIHNYFVYIITNKLKTVLYTGVTNNLSRRLSEHFTGTLRETKAFTGKYNCYHLLYWEKYQYIAKAKAREKQIKGWVRIKKENLISDFNPEWKFLENEF